MNSIEHHYKMSHTLCCKNVECGVVVARKKIFISEDYSNQKKSKPLPTVDAITISLACPAFDRVSFG